MRIGSRGVILAGLLAVTMAAPAQADQLEETSRLARAGANELALAQIDRLRPAYAEQPVEWLRWEEERFYILQTREDWQGIIDRAERLPAKTPRSFRNKAQGLAAEAYLWLGDAAHARSLYRQLLWQETDNDTAISDQRHWREGIIQTYLAEALLEDAEIAIRRYRFDFPEHDARSLAWMAEVLVQQGRYAEAVTLQDKADDGEVSALIELARLRLNADQADNLTKRAQALLTANEKASYEQWVIFAEAAALAQNYRLQVECLEQAIINRPYKVSTVFQLSGSQLWDAYLNYGRRYGNQQQLLIGDDEAWYFAATDTVDKDPVLARALFAVLALESRDAKHQHLAHDYLVKLVDEADSQGNLLGYLYLDNPRFPSVNRIPLPARYRLVDHALAQGDIKLASDLMRDLEAPPEADQVWSWQLRRARVLILGDAGDQGVTILQDLTAEPIEDPAEIDALMQVVFDLQKTDRHRAALDIFWRLQEMPLPSQRRRELFFWMAESFTALDDHESAARAYLESAILVNEHAMDQWAQTARYHAAKSLAEAGYREDARTLLEQLLRATKDKDRRVVLRQEMLQLNGHE